MTIDLETFTRGLLRIAGFEEAVVAGHQYPA